MGRSPQPVLLVEVSQGLLYTELLRGEAEVIEIDWDGLNMNANYDWAADDARALIEQIEGLHLGEGMDETLEKLHKVIEDREKIDRMAG